MKKIRCGVGVVAVVLAGFNAMFFFSMRHFWSGIYAMVRIHWLALAVMAVLLVVAVLAAFLRKRRIARWVLLGLSAALFAGLAYMFYLAFPGWPFILREFGLIALHVLVVGAVGFLVFRLGGKRFRAIKIAVVAVLSVAVFCVSYGVMPGGFKVGPAVFAVEDEYQIVFTTRADSDVWVECGGETYYDAYGGSALSGTVHKVVLPMEALDGAREYTLNARTMVFRGPYDGIWGRTHSKSVGFSPVDDSDGLRYYCISDTHDFTSSAIKTASYFGDELDFLVLAGDHASFITSETDLTRALVIANGVTGGSRPVVYARGNHEVKAALASQLDRYVGADDGRFYYTFRLGSVWGVVLDMGEDHDDNWWEFYDTAYFNDYRNAQVEFLRNLDADVEYNAPGVTTRLAICHIPLTFTYSNDFSAEIKRLLVEQLNGMDIDLMLNGHMHRLYWGTPEMEDGTVLAAYENSKELRTVIAAEFPSVITSRHSNYQLASKDSDIGSGNIGLAVETVGGVTRLWYTNNTGKAIDLWHPVTGEALAQPLLLSDLP